MDGFSAAASAAALVDLTNKLSKDLVDIKHADKECRRFHDQLLLFEPILVRLKQRMDEAAIAGNNGSLANRSKPWYRGLEKLGAVMDGLKSSMEELRDGVMPKLGMEKMKGQLMFHWKKEKFDSLLVEITRRVTTIDFMLSQDHFDLSVSSNAVVEKVEVLTSKVNVTGEDTNTRVKFIEAETKDAIPRIKGIEKTTKDSKDVLMDLSGRMRFLEIRDRKQQQEEAEKEKQNIVDWLSPLKFASRQQQLIERCFRPSGQWFIDSKEFVYWSQGRPWQLRCLGDAGSGKTTLASMAINFLQHKVGTSDPVLAIFLDQKNSATRKDLLGSILNQLIQLKDPSSLSPGIREAYSASKKGTTPPLLSDSCLNQRSTFCGEDGCIRDILYAELASYTSAYLVVDALDECAEEVRHWLDEEFFTLQDAGVRIMTTSRHIEATAPRVVDCDICPPSNDPDPKGLQLYWHCFDCDEDCDPDFTGFDICQNCKDKGIACPRDPLHELREPSEVEVQIRTPDEALRKYIEAEMLRERGDDRCDRRRDKRFRPKSRATRFGRILRNNPDMLEPVTRIIVEKADGVFLFAKLYLDTLRASQTPETISLSLNSLPATLPGIYESSMQSRILAQSPQDSETAIKILSLLALALQPLTLAALQHALAIRENDTVIDTRRMLDKELILELTHGLVVIEPHTDPSKSAVRLFHLTLHEYFETMAVKWFPNANTDIATICLRYLRLGAFSEACVHHTDFDQKINTHPFIGYAAQHFGDHFRLAIAEKGDTTNLEREAAEYLSDDSRVGAFSQAAWCTQAHCHHSCGWDVRRSVSGLHIAAYFGLSNLVPQLVARGHVGDVDAQEQTYWQTPLMYACRRGHAQAVRELLALNASVNIKSGTGRTALIEATENDQAVVVDVLLGTRPAEIAINEIYQGDFNRSALVVAARKGHVDIVESLLAHEDIDVNLQDSGGYTALSHAVIRHAVLVQELEEVNANEGLINDKLCKCERISELLFSRTDVKLDLVDAQGRSALHLAAERNDPKMTLLLLDRGVDPKLRDDQGGGNAMIRAAERGHLMVLDAMIDHGLSIDCIDDDGRNLLHCASGSVSPAAPAIIRLLIEDGLEVNAVDENGQSPLHEASRGGTLESVETLLGLGASRSIKDKSGRTPYQLAWQHDRDQDILRLLKSDDDKDGPKTWKRPLWSLAKHGDKDEVAKSLSENPRGIETERETQTNDTALHWAVRANKVECLVQLLQHDLTLASLNSANRLGRTALHVSAWFDNKEAAQVLLEKHVDLNARDKFQQTPLMIALAKWHYDFAVLLCAAGADVSAPGLDLKTILFQAVQLNNFKAVQNLVDAGVDILSKNDQFKTALEVAMEKGEEADEICQMLSSRTFYIKETNGVLTRAKSQPAASAFRMPPHALGSDVHRSSSEPILQSGRGRDVEKIQWPTVPLSPPLTPRAPALAEQHARQQRVGLAINLDPTNKEEMIPTV